MSTKVIDLANTARAYFETARRATGDTATGPREDGERYVRLKSDAPEWLTDLVRDAHRSGDSLMFPDDWRYRFIREAIDAIAEPSEGDSDEELDDLASTFADDVPAYNSERIDWLGSHGTRPGYVDEAIEGYEREIGERGIMGIITLGIYAEREEVFGLVLAALRKQASQTVEA